MKNFVDSLDVVLQIIKLIGLIAYEEFCVVLQIIKSLIKLTS